MAVFIIRRLVGLVPVLVGVSTVVFLVLHLTPGDPAQLMLGDFATAEAVERLRAEMGLDKPLHVQYGRFLRNLALGDLGRSITQRQPVVDLIAARLQATAELALVAMLFAVVFGVSAGVLAASRQNTVTDYVTSAGSLLGISTPIFYLGLLLILLFSLKLGWFPASGRGPALVPSLAVLAHGDARPLGEALRHLFLPALTLGLSFGAVLAKMTRNTMLEVLQRDFVRTAKAKGVTHWLVVFKHALRNAGIPLLTVLGLQFSSLLGGSVLTETVFAWPGLGRLAVDAIFARDFPLVQGAVLTVALIFVLLNLVVDLLYGLLDPRVSYS
jgi:peptide/nickel transport system permease protein